MADSPSEDSDKDGRPPSLIKVLASHIIIIEYTARLIREGVCTPEMEISKTPIAKRRCKESKFRYHLYLNRLGRKPVFRVSDQVRHKPGSVQPQKLGRGLKFQI